jgi:hypothetical protein
MEAMAGELRNAGQYALATVVDHHRAAGILLNTSTFNQIEAVVQVQIEPFF